MTEEDQINSIVVELVPEPSDDLTDSAKDALLSLYPTANQIALDSLRRSYLSSSKVAKVDDSLSPSKRVLSIDVETTGVNPWDYQLLVCSVWDLSKPKSEMVTFASWDEEQLCVDLFNHIADQEPDVLLAYNAKYEVRCFVTRAALYHIKAPWIWDVEWHDLMAILEGGWKNGLTGSQPTGSEEQWYEFFFGEKKPYTIDECFEGVRRGSLTEFIVRNRTCVAAQGDIYKLILYASSEWSEEVPEEVHSAARVQEGIESGNVLIRCEVCDAVNEVKLGSNPGQCWRCYSSLPQPNQLNILHEVSRQVDLSKVGLKNTD